MNGITPKRFIYILIYEKPNQNRNQYISLQTNVFKNINLVSIKISKKHRRSTFYVDILVHRQHQLSTISFIPKMCVICVSFAGITYSQLCVE